MRRGWWALPLVVGCGAPAAPQGTGGVDVPDGPCGRGLVVVQTDYQSTNVALCDVTGRVLSSSFISSGTVAPGLAAPLGGDVVVPTSRMTDDIVLIDRYPASVVTWIDPRTARVRRQLSVATGFAANPQDLVVAAGRTYVSRYETNPAPGQEPFDGGGDLLRIDGHGIAGRVDLEPAMQDAPGFLPRAGRMVSDGQRLYALLSAYDATFKGSAPSRLVVLDAESGAIIGTHVLEGLHGCGGLALWQGDGEEARLAVSCSNFAGDSTPPLAGSGLVVLSGGDEPKELYRVPASERPFGFSVTFDGPDRLLAVTLGRVEPTPLPDVVVSIDLSTLAAVEILSGQTRGFELGEVRCLGEPGDGCSACFVADAERARLHRLVRDGDGYRLDASIVVDELVGLPPRFLGAF